MYELSIVKVVLNDVVGLARTLESVRPVLSSREAVQHVIVDGGSIDGTAELAHQYAAGLDLRSVVVVSEPDDGLYDAMNKGTSRSEGRYVLFLNADDELAGSGPLRRVLAALGSTRPTWLVARTAYLDQARVVAGVSENLPFRRWRHLLGYQMHAHPSTVVRRDVIEDLGGFDPALAGFAADWDLVARVAQRSPRTVEVDEVLSLFAAGGLSGTREADVPDVLAHIRRHRFQRHAMVRHLDVVWTSVHRWRWRVHMRAKEVG
jgi:glycosyltransferase involved in cell wall biosynthesis